MTSLSAAGPAEKTFNILGTVDCGLASGKRCSIGDTVRLWTEDLSGNRELVEIDITWIKATLPALDQDDLLKLEVEDKPEGGIRALRIFKPDKPRRIIKEDDHVGVEPTPTPAPATTLTLSIDDPVVEEPTSDSEGDIVITKSFLQVQEGTATFTVTLSGPSSGIVTVNYATSDGTARGSASCDIQSTDYETVSGTLTFTPGQTSKTIDVEICDDFFDEGDETFFMNLSNPNGAGFGDPQGQATILDNDID